MSNHVEFNDKAETPFERRSCYDCKYLKAKVSWWCTNEQAIKYRNTAIPGCIHCSFWEPDWDYISPEHKLSVK